MIAPQKASCDRWTQDVGILVSHTFYAKGMPNVRVRLAILSLVETGIYGDGLAPWFDAKSTVAVSLWQEHNPRELFEFCNV
jgi:hypothetical protein